MKILLILAIFVPFLTLANPVITRVHQVVLPEPGQSDVLVFSTVDGRVYHVNRASPLLNTLQLAAETQNAVELNLDGKSITSVRILSNEISDSEKLFSADSLSPFTTPTPTTTPAATPIPPPYVPTVIDNSTLLHKLFGELTDPSRFYTRSQCFRRAEVWAYDLFMYDKINSMKVILFFTQKYIREYKYDWWFHTAPFVYYKKDGVMNEVVFDKEYFTDGGLALDDWATSFIEPGAHCAEIKKYQDYEDHQEDAYCYVRKFPMYYYNPAEVEALDKEGKVRTSFDPSDLYDTGEDMYRRKW